MTLTISQLADYVGVTVRAVRHYHQRGLLPEPERDVSGYRRYDADAVISLIRIKALADAAVPLARIQELLAAGPDEFADAVTEIDKVLAARIGELQEQRRRVAQLTSGDRPFVPPEIADLFDRIRGLGISSQAMRIERDSWILLAARYPSQVRDWAKDKLAALADPEFERIYRIYYEAADWDPADPRLLDAADVIVAYAVQHHAELEQQEAGQEASGPMGDPVAMALVRSRTAAMPPAWARLDQLCQQKARAKGLNVQVTGFPDGG